MPSLPSDLIYVSLPFVRRLLVIGGLAAVLLAAALFLFLHHREASYKGKKLHEWAELYESKTTGDPRSPESPESREALEAIRAMRDKVIPEALRLISHDKPAWKQKTGNAMEQMNVRSWAPLMLWSPFYGDPANL